jgi:predicted enzyme related to lactoylglutathione lyase
MADGIEVERTDFVALFVQDLERAKAFYGETLGLRPNTKASPDFPEFETGNTTILLLDPQKIGVEFSPSQAGIALRVADVEVARERLEEAGVTFHGPTFDSSVCHMGFFSDPDGNALVLHHRYAPHAD